MSAHKKPTQLKMAVTTVRLLPADLERYQSFAKAYGLTFSGLVRGALAMQAEVRDLVSNHATITFKEAPNCKVTHEDSYAVMHDPLSAEQVAQWVTLAKESPWPQVEQKEQE